MPIPNIVVADHILGLDQADIYAFYDHAKVSSPFPTVSLYAVGVGFRMNKRDRILGRIDLGVPLARPIPNVDTVQIFGSLTLKL